MRAEQVKQIIAEELAVWLEKQKAASDEERYFLSMPVSLLVAWSGRPDEITAEKLREEYKAQKARANTPELKDVEMDRWARKRAAYACEMVESLGKKIIKIDTVK